MYFLCFAQTTQDLTSSGMLSLILEEILLIFISMIRPSRPQPRFYLHSRWFSEVGVACFQQSWERRILSVAFDVLPRKTRQIKNSEGVRHNGLSEIVTPVFWEDGFQITIVTFHCFGQNWFGIKIDLGQGLNKQTLWHSTFFSFQPHWGFKMDDYNKCFSFWWKWLAGL